MKKILNELEILDKFKLYLKNKKYSKRTVQNYVSSMKKCLNMNWETMEQIDDAIWNTTTSFQRAKFKKVLRRFNEFREKENIYS